MLEYKLIRIENNYCQQNRNAFLLASHKFESDN